MNVEEQIRSIFPEEKSIPNEFFLSSLVEQDEYLVDGELRHWESFSVWGRSTIP